MHNPRKGRISDLLHGIARTHSAAGLCLLPRRLRLPNLRLNRNHQQWKEISVKIHGLNTISRQIRANYAFLDFSARSVPKG